MWQLVCKACTGRHEVRTIGVILSAPQRCAVCGTELPAMANGLSGGNPFWPEQVEEMRRLRPRPGQWLFSSCQGEDFGQILRVGLDANGQDILDVRLRDLNDILHCEDTDDDTMWPWNPLTMAKLEGAASVVLVVLLYTVHDAGTFVSVRCATPEGGCFRCSQSFMLFDEAFEVRLKLPPKALTEAEIWERSG